MSDIVDYGEALYGLRDLEVAPINADGTYGTWVKLPGRTLTYRVVKTFSEQKANDRVIATAGHNEKVEFTIEAGTYPLDVIEIMYGGDLQTTGLAPDEVKTLKISADDDALPQFGIRGLAMGGQGAGGGGGGALEVLIASCTATGNHEVTLQGENWVSPQVNGTGVEHPTHGLMLIAAHQSKPAAFTLPPTP